MDSQECTFPRQMGFDLSSIVHSATSVSGRSEMLLLSIGRESGWSCTGYWLCTLQIFLLGSILKPVLEPKCSKIRRYVGYRALESPIGVLSSSDTAYTIARNLRRCSFEYFQVAETLSPQQLTDSFHFAPSLPHSHCTFYCFERYVHKYVLVQEVQSYALLVITPRARNYSITGTT